MFTSDETQPRDTTKQIHLCNSAVIPNVERKKYRQWELKNIVT